MKCLSEKKNNKKSANIPIGYIKLDKVQELINITWNYNENWFKPKKLLVGN